MSDAIKCDRCGQFEAHKLKQSSVDLLLVTKVDDDGTRTMQTFEHDLCAGCTKALQAWLKPQSSKERGNG